MESDQVKKTGKKIERTQGEIVELHPTKPDITEHKKAEEAVRRSKQQWENTFNAISDWVVLIDLKGRIIRTNRIGEDFTGKPLAEIVGQSCCKLVHGTERQIPDCPLSKMLRTGQQASAELQVPGADQWLMVKVDPVTDREGNIVGAVHITRAITDRKQAEKAVRDSEKRYRHLFEQSPLGIVLASLGGRVVCTNKTMEVITGYFEAELKKLNLVDLYENPEDRKKLLKAIDRYGCAVDFPARLKRKDGTLFDALLNVSRVHLGGQDLFQTICMDITERKRAEEALRESEQKYRDLFENAQEAIITIDLNGNITGANKLVEEYGFKKNEFMGKNLFDFVPQYDKARAVSDFETLTAGNPVRGEMDIITPKGIITVDYSDNPIIRGEEIIGVQAILTDITERKRAEDALRESEDKYRKLFELGSDALFLIEVETGRILDLNDTALKMYGYSREEALQMKNTDFSAEPAQTRQATVEHEQQIPVRYHKKKDGTIFPTDISVAYFTRYGKEVCIAAIRDITERKKVEEQIEKLARFPAEDPYPVIRISARGTVVYANEASLPLLKVWRCRVGGSLSGRWYEFVLDALSSGQSQQTEVQCDGQTFSLVFAPVMDANYVNVYGLDITERKRAEEELRLRSEIMTNMSEAVYLTRASDGVIVYTNPKFEEIFGYGPNEMLGKHVSIVNVPTEKSPKETAREIMEYLEKNGYWEGEINNIKKDGMPFWCYAKVSTFEHPEHGRVWVSVHTDITERKRAETKLLDYQEQLKSLASQLTLTEEQERRRIATDLHDNITQSLAMSKLKLDLVLDSKSSADLAEVLNETSRNIEQIIQGVRTLTSDLSSPILYELGFEAAVAEWLTERIEKEHYIATEFEDDGQPKPLDDDTRTVLFRDVRELLTNVVKHAQAKKVKVSIRKDHSRIHVIVEDDGRGFDPEKVAATAVKAGEFGLFSIRERLKQLGGNIEIESAAGHGTRVTLVAPLKSKS